jgi:hypothetical protein
MKASEYIRSRSSVFVEFSEISFKGVVGHLCVCAQ